MELLPILAQQVLAQQTYAGPRAWLPIVMLIVMALVFGVMNIVASTLIGPSRTGAGKETTYESGMMPIGDTRKRFNVRFYIVAMIFLVFDVEIVFFYPWATVFPGQVAASAVDPAAAATANIMLVSMGLFVIILLIAYAYAWGKGVFRWD